MADDDENKAGGKAEETVSAFERTRRAYRDAMRAAEERRVRLAAATAAATEAAEAEYRSIVTVAELIRRLRAAGDPDDAGAGADADAGAADAGRWGKRRRIFFAARVVGAMLLLPPVRWADRRSTRAARFLVGSALGTVFSLRRAPHMHVGPCHDDCGGVSMSLLWPGSDPSRGVQIDLHIAPAEIETGETDETGEAAPGPQVIYMRPSGASDPGGRADLDAFMEALGLDPRTSGPGEEG
jgi:hypothetical protein